MPSSSSRWTGDEYAWLRMLAGLLAVALIFWVGFSAWNAAAQHRYIGSTLQRDTITIDGEGKVTGQPTLAQIGLGMYTEGTDVAQVQRQNVQQVNAVIAAMKALGIADQDMQTSQYDLSPKFNYLNGKQNLIGYSLSQTLTVKVRQLNQVSDVLAKASQLGINRINNVVFTIDDPALLKQQAREKAIQDAQQKADQLSRTLGVHLGRVVGFSEGSPAPRPLPMYAGGMGVMSAAPAAPPSPDIQTGSLDVVSDVSVTFEIK